MQYLKTKTTRIIMILAIMALSTTMVTATTNPAAENFRLANFQKQQLKQVLDRAVDYPKQADVSNEAGLVKAEVRITNDGSLEIIAINGHPALTAYVQAQLANISFADYRLIGKSFIAKFDFRN
ncbi:hypothetical protein [Salinivirga cyanobacteriivorans]|uniref:TonB C-terminal domain-containing protein n=1 Tax=Salinivirga cyanobacteriivorans TaxID=1307839 RepID=A0A0S2HYW7_9BACT|nr:hypothetical protein [Salinivirga cyanobacteriivorans]ALO15321.1 hypothetical protein L21SP5_01678 [Salinivirga cyanobacteriivorans]